VVATIEESGTPHVAAVCNDAIRYSVQKGDSWSSQTFPAPAHRADVEPQLAFSGDTLYLAFSRIALSEGGCGDDGTRGVGVYYRQRTLPNGQWSSATRLDAFNERLQSFRVSGGTLHAVVTDVASGRTYYVVSSGGTAHRYPIAGTGASLRIGDDGNARIAYGTTHGLRFGTFNGSTFAATAVTESPKDGSPLLVLDGQSHAHILFTRTNATGGCAEPEPDPDDGIYYATNAGGTWVSTRISKGIGEASFTVDPATGQVHAVLDIGAGLRYVTNASGRWTQRRIVSGDVYNAVIRLDAATGKLVVAYVGRKNGVYVRIRN
jgi:hypothetical protein